MLAFLLPWKRNKGAIKATTSRAYPYPRTHTTLMVIPSTRPIEKPEPRPMRRRPPLNKACPTIPESKSNESIMSHASRKSTIKEPEPLLGLVIENRNVVNVLHRLDSNIPRTTTTTTTTMNKKSTPKSPLLSVAHSVRNKFNKITQFARSTTNNDEACGSMKGSKSFSGIRQPKTIPKRTDQNANRVIKSTSMDVPSSSKVFIPQSSAPLDDKIEEMSETGLIPASQMIPKLCVKLDDDVLVVTSEQFYGKRSASPDTPLVEETRRVEEVMDANGNPQVTTTTERILKEDGRMVRETIVEETVTRIVEETDPEMIPETAPETVPEMIPETVSETVPEILEKSTPIFDEPEVFMQTMQLETIQYAKMQHMVEEPVDVAISPDRYVMLVKSPESHRAHRSFTIETKADVAVVPEPTEPAQVAEKKSKERAEESISPERYVMLVKSPESHRQFRNFTIGFKEPEEKMEADVLTRIPSPEPLVKAKKRAEESISPDRYVMLVKSPESHRQYRNFTIGPKEPTSILRSKSDAHVSKKLKFEKQQSEPERFVSPERYVMLVKTPEALRKHKTLTIGERTGTLVKSKSEVDVEKKTKKSKLVKQKSEPERYVSPERFVMVVKTPEALRKHRTLTIGEVSMMEPEIEPPKVVAEVEAPKMTSLEKTAMKEKLKRDKSLESEKAEVAKEKFVLVLKTPEALRRHHTFTVGDRPKSPDYPYIEEGEVTEPIATVGPPAERRRKQERKEEKRRIYEESQKPVEKFVMTATTPTAMRKYQTFVIEPKETTTTDTTEKMKRSQSCETKKHSYLHRLQLELFRGRSRERKKQTRRQKSLDETKASSTQKYILSTTTPLMARKYQTFAVEEKKLAKNEEKIIDNFSPVKTSDLYSITVTTPLATRKSTSNSLASPESIEKAPSPESRKLFVMGGRRPTTPRAEHSKDRLKLESPNKSMSTNAERLERKSSLFSDDLTSPEEDIPLDSVAPTSRKMSEHREAPVFVPPSPPKSPLVATKSISTSTSSSSTSSEERKAKLALLPLKKSFELEEEVKPKKKEKMAVKSLKNASKKLTPSFLRKERKPAHGRELLGAKKNAPPTRKAPLAESESSVVANSPIVENMPITYEKWAKRPSSRSARCSETIKEETYFSPNVQRKNIMSEFQDDEILDQPMLVGDNFSHSSVEGILNAKMTESMISIDRSVMQESIKEENMEQLIEESVTNVADIKQQLRTLQKLLADIDSGDWASELERLRAENNSLKQQLTEKDAIIDSLTRQKEKH